MFLLRSLLVLAIPVVLVPALIAQPMKVEPFDYRRLLRPPATTPEYWEAMVFEMEVGRFDLAAGHLNTMLAKKPTPDDLIRLHQKEGIATFLRLRLVPRWFEDRAKHDQTVENVETLIKQVTEAVRAHLTNPVRIRTYINNLYGPPEEAAFARVELTTSGYAAVPLLIEEMLRKPEADRRPILDALTGLRGDAMLPVLAALDINDNVLRENLLDMLKRRRDLFLLRPNGVDVAPTLWGLAGLSTSAGVKRKAREVLAIVYDLSSPDRLPLPINELTAEAERYHLHQVRDPRKLALWRWDGKRLVEDPAITATKAEELLGLRYAKQALQINSTHEPAQIILLSLLVDKGYQAPSPDRPLGSLRPTVEELLLTLNADLLNATLEQALRDERTPVILSTIKALGKLADTRALKPQTAGEPALVRALHHGDRRVQMAAAQAVLSIPGAASLQAGSRILTILKEVLVPEAMAHERPRVLVASARERYLTDLVRSVEGAGYDSAIATTGRGALRRLLSKADVDAVLIDSTLPDPGLSSLLAQLRADSSLRRLPVFVTAIPEGPETRLLVEQLNDLRVKLRAIDDELAPRLEQRARNAESTSVYALRSQTKDPLLDDLRKRKTLMEERLIKLSDQFEVVSTQREEALRKHLEKQKHVWVLPANPLREARILAVRLDEKVRQSGMFPLSKVERKEYAEAALGWLVKMAVGDLPGFEVKPAEDAVIGMLRAPGFSEASVLNAVRFLGRVNGGKAQRALIGVLLDTKRPVPVRIVAADALRRHLQENGLPDAAQQRVLLTALEVELKQPGLDANLRDRLTRFVGGLRPGDRTTGQKLRDFGP